MNQRHAAASALMALALLAGCSDVNEFLGGEESIDYKSTKRGEPLSIPPDLSGIERSTLSCSCLGQHHVLAISRAGSASRLFVSTD